MEKLIIDETVYDTTYTKKYKNRKPFTPKDTKKVEAAIPGVIKDIFVVKGQRVHKGDPVLILEAMKMYNEIRANDDGVVKTINVSTGDKVVKKQLLIEIE